MKAHIVGGGFGGLATAALLIRNADVPGADITIYEADDVLGGGFFLGGSAAGGYNLPGSVFDKEFRCTFDLLKSIPSARNPSISVTEDVALEDLVLVTTGSQAADLSAGSMTEVPSPRPSGRSWSLWERLAQGRRDFGNPDVFFGTARIPDSLWVTFNGHRHRARIRQSNRRVDRKRGGTRRTRDVEGLRLGAVAVRLSPTGNYRPAQGHERLVGPRSVSRAQRRFCAQTDDGVHRRGNPGGDAAARHPRRDR